MAATVPVVTHFPFIWMVFLLTVSADTVLDKFELHATTSRCDSLPSEVELVTSLEMTNETFDWLVIYNITGGTQLYFEGVDSTDGIYRVLHDNRVTAFTPIQLSPPTSPLYSNQSIKFEVTCAGLMDFSVRAESKDPRTRSRYEGQLICPSKEPELRLRFAEPDSEDIILNGTEVQQHLIAEYSDAWKRPDSTEIHIQEGVRVYKEVAPSRHQMRLDNCTWHGSTEADLTFFQAGLIDVYYTVQIAGKKYSTVLTVNVTDIAGASMGKSTMMRQSHLVVIVLAVIVSVALPFAIIGCLWCLFPEPLIRFRHFVCCDITVKEDFEFDAELSEADRKEIMRRCWTTIDKENAENEIRDGDRADAMPDDGEEMDTLDSTVTHPSTRSFRLIGRPEDIAKCKTYLEEHLSKEREGLRSRAA